MFATAAFGVAQAQSVSGVDALSARLSVSAQDLQRFKKSGSLDDLRTTIYAMQAALNTDSLTPQNFVASRRLLVQGWANTLAAVEKSYDPTFNPSLTLACPIPPGGGLPPCADPSTIANAAKRAEYTSELTKFHSYLDQNARYQKLVLLDELAMTSLKMSLDLLRQVSLRKPWLLRLR
ncbi:MAG: hypothetical protein WBD74_14755 [Candidatus Aquilonibacter sp.]